MYGSSISRFCFNLQASRQGPVHTAWSAFSTSSLLILLHKNYTQYSYVFISILILLLLCAHYPQSTHRSPATYRLLIPDLRLLYPGKDTGSHDRFTGFTTHHKLLLLLLYCCYSCCCYGYYHCRLFPAEGRTTHRKTPQIIAKKRALNLQAASCTTTTSRVRGMKDKNSNATEEYKCPRSLCALALSVAQVQEEEVKLRRRLSRKLRSEIVGSAALLVVSPFSSPSSEVLVGSAYSSAGSSSIRMAAEQKTPTATRAGRGYVRRDFYFGSGEVEVGDLVS